MIVRTLLGDGLTAVAQTPSFIFGTVFPLTRGGGHCHTWLSALHLESWHLSTLVFIIRVDILPHIEAKAVVAYRSQWPVVQTHMICPVTTKVQRKLAFFSDQFYRYFSMYAVVEFQKQFAYGEVSQMKTNLQASFSSCASLVTLVDSQSNFQMPSGLFRPKCLHLVWHHHVDTRQAIVFVNSLDETWKFTFNVALSSKILFDYMMWLYSHSCTPPSVGLG
jgi:hypothetical protein